MQIAGFVIRGAGPKKILIRACGPALRDFNIAGRLRDPTIALYDQSTQRMMAIADNWQPELADDFTRMGAFVWRAGSMDAAMVATLAPGAYTVVVRGNLGTWTSLHTNAATLSEWHWSRSPKTIDRSEQEVSVAG